MTSIPDLARRAHEASVAKGFDPPRWAGDYVDAGPTKLWKETNYLAKLMLVVTEIDEVVRAAGVTAIGEELADVVLRVLPLLHVCHEPKWLVDLDWLVRERKTPLSRVLRPHDYREAGVLIRQCVQAAEAWRKDDASGAALVLHNLVLSTFFVADVYSVDLFAAIEAKMAKNAAREYRHGKKSTG